jgi:catechol 2,3-dioxygenase-like lactoylglutathione lyase family enzyme
MLGSSRVMASIPVSDTARSRVFYEGTLGLEVVHEDLADGSVEYQCGNGTRLFTYPTGNAGKSPATQAAWQVEDVVGTAQQLRDAGVELEDYDFPGLTTVSGIATLSSPTVTAKVAWFKDPDGNILSVFERPFV